MKNRTLSATLCWAVWLASCQPDKPAATTTPAQGPAIAAPNAPTAAVPAGNLTSADTTQTTEHDTLHVAGQVLYVRLSTAAAFARLQATDPLPGEPQGLVDRPLVATAGRVRRQGDRLILQPEKGAAVVLLNTSADNQNGERDAYWGSLPLAHQWVVDATYYESDGVALIDQRTGHRTDVAGRPVVSPDGRYLFSTCYGLGGGDAVNALQLYRLDANGPHLLWERTLEHWGANLARWSGPRTLILKQEHEGPLSGGDAPPTYAELRLPAQP